MAGGAVSGLATLIDEGYEVERLFSGLEWARPLPEGVGLEAPPPGERGVEPPRVLECGEDSRPLCSLVLGWMLAAGRGRLEAVERLDDRLPGVLEASMMLCDAVSVE